jgi:hypothetical protein
MLTLPSSFAFTDFGITNTIFFFCFLILLLDSKLHFCHHIDYIFSKSLKMLGHIFLHKLSFTLLHHSGN